MEILNQKSSVLSASNVSTIVFGKSKKISFVGSLLTSINTALTTSSYGIVNLPHKVEFYAKVKIVNFQPKKRYYNDIKV